MARRESASIEEQADRIVRQLGGKWQGDFAMCRCPAHADGKASLSIRVGERAVLFHCFAGCTADAIMSAVRTGKILAPARLEEPTSELQSLVRIPSAVLCLKTNRHVVGATHVHP